MQTRDFEREQQSSKNWDMSSDLKHTDMKIK